MQLEPVFFSVDDSTINSRTTKVKYGIIGFRRLRSCRWFITRSAMLIGIGFLLASFVYFSHVHLTSHSMSVASDRFLLYISSNRNSSVTSLSTQTKAKKVELVLPDAEPSVSCVFGVLSSDGAFGNRMFLFASAYGLARLHGCHLYLRHKMTFDLRSTFTVHLNHTPVKLLKDSAEFENRTDVFRRYSSCTLFDDLFKVPLLHNFTRYELVGFYQAYGYFEPYRKEIAYLFDFNQETIKKITPFVEEIIKSVWNYSIKFYANNSIVKHQTLKSFLHNPPSSLPPVTWVGVHIRRTDFLTFFKIDTSTSYLYEAVGYYRKKYVNCRFVIASDDKEYVMKHLGNFSDVLITPSSFFHGHDLAALALCEHSILTAGTFSWWAAWLAGGDVIHDLNYPVPFQKCIREHYFPPWFLFPHNSSSKQWEPPKTQ